MSEEVLHKVQHISLYPRSISTPPPEESICLFFSLRYATPYFAFGHRIALQDFWCHSSWKKVYKEHHQKEEERGEIWVC